MALNTSKCNLLTPLRFKRLARLELPSIVYLRLFDHTLSGRDLTMQSFNICPQMHRSCRFREIVQAICEISRSQIDGRTEALTDGRTDNLKT